MGNAERFSGKVALVTGASSGIGEAAARRLRDEGARVASFDLHAKAPEDVLALSGDVSSSTDVEAAVAQVRRELGPIDILVCSAGVPGVSLATVDVTDEEWRRVMGINADGVFYSNRAVIPDMVERGYGRIVNVASIAGKEGNPMAGAYSASKAAVIAMTKAIGKDLARTGVLVNCVAPAVIETPILDGITEEHIDYMVERIPMGRMGEPEEVAALICWLASEECSFSTGATYDISGGRAVYYGALRPGARAERRGERVRPGRSGRHGWRRVDRAARSRDPPAARALRAHGSDPGARGVVRRRDLRALPRRTRRGERREGRLHDGLRRAAPRAVHEGRRHASHGRARAARSGFATTRPGTCRSRRSASSSGSTAA